MNDYFQGPQRTPIQIERKESGDWIVWNWRTASWDKVANGVNANGEAKPSGK